MRAEAELLAETTRSLFADEGDLSVTIERVASLILDATRAYRVTIFRVVGDGDLELWSTTSRNPRQEMWEIGLSLGPISLDDVPLRRAIFDDGVPFAVPDCANSDIVPADWVELFQLGALIAVPLEVRGEAVGLLVADWREPRTIPPEVLNGAAAVGGCLALAIVNARLSDSLASHSGQLERLVELSADLHEPAPLEKVLLKICNAYEALLGSSHCSVNILDPRSAHGLRTLATAGERWFADHPAGIAGVVPEAEMDRVEESWKQSPDPALYPAARNLGIVEPSLLPPVVESVAVFPLAGSGGLSGFIVTGYPHKEGPTPGQLDVGRLLAVQAASAVEQATLHETLRRRVQELEVLERLSDVVAGTSDLDAAVTELNATVREPLGLELRSVSLIDARLRDAVGARAPDSAEVAAVGTWTAALAEKRLPLQVVGDEGGVLVPIVRGQRLQGVLKARRIGSDVEVDDGLLLAIGSACAEVVAKAGLRDAVEESERRLAVAVERERIARDLHDSTGQALLGIGLRLASWEEDAPDDRWKEEIKEMRELARTGTADLRRTIGGLVFDEVRRRGLLLSLEELANRLELTTDLSVSFSVDGAIRRLAPAQEAALYRVAHEALANVERHARARHAEVVLRFTDTEASVVVSDDGVGFDPAEPRQGHYGLAFLTEQVRSAGGELTIGSGAEKGTTVQARVPTAEAGAIR